MSESGTHAAGEFFARPMYMFRITGFPPLRDVLTRSASAPHGARLDVWPTDPADDRDIPAPDADGVTFSTSDFSLANTGNRTLRSPKRSWKITLGHAGNDANALAGMTCVNLKSMYNDPSQMREALAWQLLGIAGIPAARHTYAKLAMNGVYLGLFSLVEQVDKRFLTHHFGDNDRGNLYKAYCGDVGCATLEYRTGPDGDDSGRQYYRVGADDDRTYRLKTNKDDRDAGTYDDLATLVRTINGVGLAGGDGRFDTDAFRESVENVMNVWAFLRWAGVNLLLGAWDNYYATPSNYYLYNSGRRGAQDDFMSFPYFTFIPWGYDNCLGIDYFGTQWQYTDILDWPANTRRYNGDRGTSRIPLVQNTLRNHDFCQYYLDHLEYLLDSAFTPDLMAQRMGLNGDGLWKRVSRAAFLESDSPDGPPFTGRQFTNNEVYQSGFQQWELRHGQERAEGIVHYTRMRYDSARAQLSRLRAAYPHGDNGHNFPQTMEALPARP